MDFWLYMAKVGREAGDAHLELRNLSTTGWTGDRGFRGSLLETKAQQRFLLVFLSTATPLACARPQRFFDRTQQLDVPIRPSPY